MQSLTKDGLFLQCGLKQGSLLEKIPLTLSRPGGHPHKPLHDKAAAVRKVLKKCFQGKVQICPLEMYLFQPS